MNKILSNYKNLNAKAQKQLLELFKNQGRNASTPSEDDERPVEVADVQISLDEGTSANEDDGARGSKKLNTEHVEVKQAPASQKTSSSYDHGTSR